MVGGGGVNIQPAGPVVAPQLRLALDGHPSQLEWKLPYPGSGTFDHSCLCFGFMFMVIEPTEVAQVCMLIVDI